MTNRELIERTVNRESNFCLIEGDCFDIMPYIPDKSVDMILCDLPYGTTKCKWDIILPFDKLWENYKRVIKGNGVILLFGTEPFSSYLRLSNIPWYIYDWYWNKKRAGNFLFMNKQPGRLLENIMVFYEFQPTYTPQKILNPKGPSERHLYANDNKVHNHLKEIMGDTWQATQIISGQNYKGKDYEPDKLLPNNVLEYTKLTKRVHPTQKPVPLLEYLIRTYTNQGELILDNCCGSFSTGQAAINTSRRCIGIEKESRYINIAINYLNAQARRM